MKNEQEQNIVLASREAEESIIAMLIADSDTHKYIKDIDVEDFYYLQNRKIFEIIKELYEKEETIDILTVKEAGVTKKYDGQKLMTTLVETTDNLPFITNMEKTVDILKNWSMKRKVQKVAKEIYKEVAEIDVYAEESEIKNLAIQKLKELKTMKKNSATEMYDVVIETMKDLDDKYKKRDDYSYRTGYLELDNIIEGLHEQELTIIAARPRRWKNSICFANGRTHCKQRKIYIFCKSRNE